MSVQLSSLAPKADSVSTGRWRLWSTLVIPFVLQITATVGVVGWLSFRNGQQAVNELANELMDEVGSRVETHLEPFLELPFNVSQDLKDILDLDFVSRSDIDPIKDYFIRKFRQYPQLTWLTFATEDPNYLDVVSDGSGGFSFSIWNPEEGGTLRFLQDSTGVITPIGRNPDYDHRQRPWYQNYRAAEGLIWDQISVSIDPQLLLLSAGQPLFDPDGSFVGVVAVDFSLSRIGDFLQRVEVSPNGQVFVVERSGLLVGSSTGEDPFQANAEGEPDRIKITESQDPLTAAVGAYLVEADFLQADPTSAVSGTSTQDPTQDRIQLAGIRHFLQVMPYQDPRGLDWLIVVAVPESDFMGRIEANRRTTVMLSGLALLVATGIGLWTARWISGQVRQLHLASRAIAGGDLERQVSLSRIREFQALGQTFNQMAQQLRQSFQTLEDRVEARTAELKTANAEISRLNAELKSENRRMGAELEVTRLMQQMILPRIEELAGIPGLDIAGYMDPASEVGGDYYDVLVAQGQIKIGIGDVTGHGLQSGVLMLMVQTAVRTLLACNEQDPIRFLAVLNRVVYDNIQRMNADKNMTLALLDYQDGSLKLSGSHEEMLIIRNNGQVERIGTHLLGLPLGLEADITDYVAQFEARMDPGDVVVLYTDGITEAANPEGELYGLDRLCEQIKCYRHASAQAIQTAVIEHLREFIGSQEVYDDITLLVMKRRHPSDQPDQLAVHPALVEMGGNQLG